MEFASFCNICLNSENILKIQQSGMISKILISFVGNPEIVTENNVYLCWYCCTKLQDYDKFRDMCYTNFLHFRHSYLDLKRELEVVSDPDINVKLRNFINTKLFNQCDSAIFDECEDIKPDVIALHNDILNVKTGEKFSSVMNQDMGSVDRAKLVQSYCDMTEGREDVKPDVAALQTNTSSAEKRVDIGSEINFFKYQKWNENFKPIENTVRGTASERAITEVTSTSTQLFREGRDSTNRNLHTKLNTEINLGEADTQEEIQQHSIRESISFSNHSVFGHLNLPAAVDHYQVVKRQQKNNKNCSNSSAGQVRSDNKKTVQQRNHNTTFEFVKCEEDEPSNRELNLVQETSAGNEIVGSLSTSTSMKRSSLTPKSSRLIERHFADYIPPNSSRANVTRRCKMCYSKGLRKESRFWCADCNVVLCMPHCFKKYHTMK